MKDVSILIEDTTGRYARPYATAVADMMVAMVRGNGEAFRDASERLNKVIRETSGIAAVIGAGGVLRAAGAVIDSGQAFKEPAVQVILRKVTFAEAVDDLLKRTPVTIKDAAHRTAARLSQIYGEGSKIAFARSAEDAVTERAQKFIASAFEQGAGENDAATILARGVEEVREETAAWSESYARLSFRNNVNTAVSEARVQQALDPDIAKVIPCMRFDSVGDGDTRDNHDAADGMIFRPDNPDWQHMRPPIGHQCRCQWSLVSAPQLRRMGRVAEDGTIREDRVPAGAHPDKGFK